MPIFITRGNYTSDAIKGMIASPEDRALSVAKLYEAVGAKMLAYYLTFGDDDWLVIGECPDEKAAAALAIAASAGGSLTNVKTTLALTTKDAMAVFKTAGDVGKSFKSAGKSAGKSA